MNDRNGDAILFRAAPGASSSPSPSDGNTQEIHPWRILVVDDDPDVHRVTRYALRDVTVEGAPLIILTAHSAEEGFQILSRERDVGLALLDVVMEEEDAGLKLIKRIRGELGNQAIRIVLRTGQPGSAPEREVVASYDINDYKEKSELTANKLYTLVHSALRSYRDIRSLERNRMGLEKIIDATADMFEPRSVDRFANGVFEQMAALLHLDTDVVYCSGDSRLLTRLTGGKLRIVAASGEYASQVGRSIEDALPPKLIQRFKECCASRRSFHGDGSLTVYCPGGSEECNIVHIDGIDGFDDIDMALVDVFARNIGVALHNLLLRIESETNQREVSLLLGETIEARSRETGNHVRRVAKCSRILGEGVGLTERELELLETAAPLHDVGKIAVPDAVLDKPGPLNDDERALMREHAAVGWKLLSRQGRPVFQVAAMVAREHHEKWDGTGYPRGLRGEEIGVFGRIVAVADVFDALLSARCYKRAWSLDRAVAHMREERGRHFDPRLVDVLLDRLDDILAVRDTYPDPETGP